MKFSPVTFPPHCQLGPRWLPLQYSAMFAARPFVLNIAPAAQVRVAARAISIKTTTIKG